MNLMPQDMLAEPEPRLDNGVEWVDGRAVEKPMGIESSVVNMALAGALVPFVSAGKLGVVCGPDAGYQLPGLSKRQVRKPDLSFIAAGRFPGGAAPRGDAALAPDLAVEVISPNDLAEEVERRLSELLQAGTRLVWIIYPLTRSVWVLRRDGSAARLTESQHLSGEDVVPGFSCPVASLFAGLGTTSPP